MHPFKTIVYGLTLALSLFPNYSQAQFNPVFDISALNSLNGFVINGEVQFDFVGSSVSSAGDINGDGIDDLMISALRDNGFSSVFVVFGSDSQLPSPLNLGNLDGSNGFVINAIDQFDSAGSSLSTAGDFNGDGLDDIIIGATGAGSVGGGESYVVFGSNSSFPNPLDLSTLNGINGLVIKGSQFQVSTGASVSSVGDFNGDGVDDIIIGAFGYFEAGQGQVPPKAYVLFGSNDPLPNPINLDNLDGSNGMYINGIQDGSNYELVVSSAGDFNGDGIDDVIVSNYSADNGNNEDVGRSHVVFGFDDDSVNSINLADLNAINGFTIDGLAADDLSGFAISSAGDINADGVSDLIIGAPGAGSGYVIYGNTGPLANPFDLNDINGINGFLLTGNNSAGQSVSSAGDVNGDDIDDLIIGAPGSEGSSYVVFGSRSRLPNPFLFSTLDGSNGFVIDGNLTFFSRESVRSAGDINDDGIDDIIIGAYNASSNGNEGAGSSYVVFGNDGIFNDAFEE